MEAFGSSTAVVCFRDQATGVRIRNLLQAPGMSVLAVSTARSRDAAEAPAKSGGEGILGTSGDTAPQNSFMALRGDFARGRIASGYTPLAIRILSIQGQCHRRQQGADHAS